MNYPFDDYEELVRSVAEQVSRRYRHDFGDLYGEAFLLFLTARATYNPVFGVAFEHWLDYKIRYGLKTYLRAERRKRSREAPESDLQVAPGDSPSVTESAPARREGRLRAFAEGLGGAAREVVALFADPPPDVLFEIRRTVFTDEGMNADWYLWAVTELLRDWGWRQDQIVKAFAEIRQKLKEGYP